MEETSDVELEQRMALATDAAAVADRAVVGHMVVGTPVEVDIGIAAADIGIAAADIGIAAAEQKYHMAADIVAEVEVCHMAVVVASRTPTDHPSVEHPSLANPVARNPVAVHSSAVEDTNLVELAERACQSAVELPPVP